MSERKTAALGNEKARMERALKDDAAIDRIRRQNADHADEQTPGKIYQEWIASKKLPPMTMAEKAKLAATLVGSIPDDELKSLIRDME